MIDEPHPEHLASLHGGHRDVNGVGAQTCLVPGLLGQGLSTEHMKSPSYVCGVERMALGEGANLENAVVKTLVSQIVVLSMRVLVSFYRRKEISTFIFIIQLCFLGGK